MQILDRILEKNRKRNMLVVHFFENETNFLLTGVKHAFLQKQAAVVENNVEVCPFREVRQEYILSMGYF